MNNFLRYIPGFRSDIKWKKGCCCHILHYRPTDALRFFSTKSDYSIYSLLGIDGRSCFC